MVVMSPIKRFDHVGITIDDIETATEFFVRLGLEIDGRTFVEGEFVDTVCGIPGSRCEVVGLRAPGGDAWIELSKFHSPDPVPGTPDAMSNVLGLRNVAFEVDDLHTTVADLASAGYGLVGGVGEYEGAWAMAYVRGPEGLIVALAQRIAAASR
jgi:catechol 2,3-dioxygenase-like lactoylglutathione lyase family enzyme